MSFRLVPNSVTLDDLEFGKPALQKTMCGGIYARVYCIFSACAMSSQRKFTFAISSPDEFLVSASIQVFSIYLPSTHEPYLPLLHSGKASPPFGWYSLRLLTKGWQG